MTDAFDWMSAPATEKGVQEERDRADKNWARKKQKRLWLRVKSEKKIVLLDDQPLMFQEHNLFLNGGRKGNWFPCIEKLDQRDRPELKPYWGGCPLCLAGDQAYTIGLLSALVVTPFTIEKGQDRGKEIRNYVNLLPLKGANSIEWALSEKRERGSLVGALYVLRRTKKQGEPSYGMPSFLRTVDLNSRDFDGVDKDGKATRPAPFKYREIVAPLTFVEMNRVAAQWRAQSEASKSRPRREDDDDDGDSGSGGDYEQSASPAGGGNGGGNDDIPFIHQMTTEPKHSRRQRLWEKF